MHTTRVIDKEFEPYLTAAELDQAIAEEAQLNQQATAGTSEGRTSARRR